MFDYIFINVLIALKKLNDESICCHTFNNIQKKEDFLLRDDYHLISVYWCLSIYLAFRNNYKIPIHHFSNMPR